MGSKQELAPGWAGIPAKWTSSAKGGVGRAWSLLTGERAHYELAAKRPREAEALMRAMEAFAVRVIEPDRSPPF